MYAVLKPAYGQDYKNKDEVTKAFHRNRDFVLASAPGGYTSKVELKRMGFNQVELRYRKLQYCVIINLEA